jgi:GT2 family glycosyltransferase
MFAHCYSNLMLIQASPGWRMLVRCHQLCDRLLPPGSRGRRITGGLLGCGLRLTRTVQRVARRMAPGAVGTHYADWIRNNEPGQDELASQRTACFARPLKISIVTPTYETPLALLKGMLQSVREQTYPDWELCIADGGSSSQVQGVLKEEASRDPRVKAVFLPRNEGITGNSAAALARATGQYVTFLDHDDLLAPFALFEVARAIEQELEADVLYSDEDKIDSSGARQQHHFKPDWSPDLLRSRNYIGHLAVYRRDLLEQIGGLRDGFEGAQDYDLVLRASERARKIVHIPRVLYHRRIHARSTGPQANPKGIGHASGRQALQEHLRRCGSAGTVTEGPLPNSFYVSYRLRRRPLISVIVPTRDHVALLARCFDSILTSTYDRREILVIENNSKDPETLAYYRRLAGRQDVRVLTWAHPFNFASLNNWAAAQVRGEVLVFLNNDVEVITPGWMERMLEHALRPEVGVVGAKLYYPNDTVQHGGVVLGIGAGGNFRGITLSGGATAGHAHSHFPRGSRGYDDRLAVIQNFSAVTAACLMMRKDLFEKVGGFDEEFALDFNDVDLCLRVRDAGYSIVWTPLAELYHHESATRGQKDTSEKRARYHDEVVRFAMKWGDRLWRTDPYYNPNLARDAASFDLHS